MAPYGARPDQMHVAEHAPADFRDAYDRWRKPWTTIGGCSRSWRRHPGEDPSFLAACISARPMISPSLARRPFSAWTQFMRAVP